jgi:hypothetical protein
MAAILRRSGPWSTLGQAAVPAAAAISRNSERDQDIT